MPLTYLDFADTLVPDVLALHGTPLEHVIFYKTQVSDLSPLRGMPLMFVSCSRTLVFDLSALESCKILKTLNVKFTKVTPAQVAALQKALPNCKIEWDAAAPSPQPSPVKGEGAKPNTPQPAAASGLDRKAAEWVLSKGGSVTIAVGNSKPRQLTTPDGLPTDAFTVREIDLSRNSSVDDGLASVQGLANLAKLSFRSTKVSVNGLTALKDLPVLNELSLNASGLTDEHLAAITHLKTLRWLDVAGNPRLTEKGLASLKAFPHLGNLNLSYDGITDAGLRELTSLQELDSLELTNARITDTGVLEFQQMPKLRFLGLSVQKGFPTLPARHSQSWRRCKT